MADGFAVPELLTTREVAEYLRLKERKVYELVAERLIPCTRVTGKWLFPRTLIDLWILQHTDPALRPVTSAPRVVAGSHDPLLEWALAESDGGLAILLDGSLDGLVRLASRQALACGLHVFDAESGEYNVAAARQTLVGLDVVLVEWAQREQGLMVPPGNPLGLTDLQTVCERRARFVDRQTEAGSHLLLEYLLGARQLTLPDLNIELPPARSEMEIGLAVLEGKADVGLGIGAVARRLRLEFVPLHRERYDLAVGRRDYFEPPFQQLLAFTRTARFAERAAELGGYDIGGLGRVVYNAP